MKMKAAAEMIRKKGGEGTMNVEQETYEAWC
jgi:hypothetical protein